MLKINAELYFKSINERHALTFLISTTWLEIINVYIFVFPFINKCLKKDILWWRDLKSVTI